MSAFQNGEEWAYSQLYTRFRKFVFRYVSQRVRDEESALEITQEVFLKVFRFRSSYRLEEPFTTWLRAVARNTVIDFHRKRKREMEAGAESVGAEADELPASESPDAEELLERKLRKQSLKRISGKLTRLQRKVLWLRVVYQLPYAEIAKRLGISLSAAKCMAYRSKRAIAQMGHIPALF